MPAVGQDSGTTYYEHQINDPAKLASMKLEVLANIDDTESVVIPVRHQVTPHFRTLSRGAFCTRVGRSEQDESHNKCIETLLSKLADKPVGILTYVFERNNRDTYILLKPSRKSSYSWYKEARIPLGGGRYIQSDVCGRDVSEFSMGTKNPGIVIEVVQTHLPEKETFYALLDASRRNMFVGFYFIGPGRHASKFNSTYAEGDSIRLRFAYYLMGGNFYENGVQVARNVESDDEWYQLLLARQFANAMEHKADERT